MPHIEPFKGILYNPKKVDISKVVAPPYDVISPRMQDELYREDKYNIVRLILGKEEAGDLETNNKYKRAKHFFNTWLKDKVLIQDKKAAIYLCSQEYMHENKKKTRWGFIARMEIEDPKISRVLPHEYTFAKPKEDRLNLIREVKANLSPIFTLFHDKGDQANQLLKTTFNKKAVFDMKKDGVRHRLWRLEDKALIKKVQTLMRGKDIFIADGHHRYEVAVLYRAQMRGKEGQGSRLKAQGYDYVMMYFAPMSEEGLTILSTHRLIKDVDMDINELLKKFNTYFYVEAVKSTAQLFKKMSSAKKGECTLGMYFKNKQFYFLKLKKEVVLDEAIKENKSKEWKRLDVSILHGLILDNILGLKEKVSNEEGVFYTRDPNYAIKEVQKGKYKAAFFLNPTKVTQVRDIANIGERMPHKSTYFYPKLLSGLVINKLA